MKAGALSVLLWSVGFYALATLGLNVFMDRWCPNSPERIYRNKLQGLCRLVREEKGRPLVVMLGSSRVDGNFQAGRLDGLPGPDGRPLAVYNFGVPAVGSIHELVYLREMIGHGVRPRLLLIEFTPPLFHDPQTRMACEENWTTPEWVSGSQLAQMLPYFTRRQRAGRMWLEARLAPWYTYRWFIGDRIKDPDGSLSHIALDHRPRDRWGWRRPEDFTPSDRALGRKATRDYIPVLERFRLGRGSAQALRDLLAYCRREHIAAALVLSPESRTMRGWYSPNCRRQIDDFLAELRAAYDVAILDGREWVDDDDDYVDGNHLAVSGATKFSTRMIAEVRRILQ